MHAVRVATQRTGQQWDIFKKHTRPAMAFAAVDQDGVIRAANVPGRPLYRAARASYIHTSLLSKLTILWPAIIWTACIRDVN